MPIDSKLRRAAADYERIKRYFLMDNTEDQWNIVSADPRLFNRVWRSAINKRDNNNLPITDEPPPTKYRSQMNTIWIVAANADNGKRVYLPNYSGLHEE
jgi:hypothetical protein